MSEKKILVVEDQAVMRHLCVDVLQRHGFDAIVATNGREGIQLYRERHEEISLVLSDIVMPLMNGIEMVQNILDMHSQAKVILMSSFTVAHIITGTLKRVCTVIEKPFTSDQLVEAVTRCLQAAGDQYHSLLAGTE